MPQFQIFTLLAYFIGGLFAFLGVLFLIASAEIPTRIIPGFVLLGIGALIAYAGSSGPRRKRRMKEIQDDIIRLAKERGGKLTLAEVVSELGISVDLAREALLSLERSGIAYLDFEKIGEEGIEVYRFPGL